MTKSSRALLFLLCFAAAARAEVTITEAVYEGAPHYVVRTTGATYWYDRAGGGLSRLIDREGRDWISFKREPWGKTPDSAASAYRGLPNFVHGATGDAGAGHPGFTKCESRQVGVNAITTVSKSGKWQWTWTFADDYARVTMGKADAAAAYWFLYEGTPGGAYRPRSFYWGAAAGGPRRDIPDFVKGGRRIELMRWVYFGADDVGRALFIAQHEPDDIPDVFGVMGNTKDGLDAPDGMTVFGFGRAKEPKPLLTSAPQTFIVGFYEQRVADAKAHALLGRRLESLLKQSPDK